uniref:Uncharacterized protein n=1 Tax=Arundo donax TaxID=35708 RepID=A0A0A8ZGE4_ARUDO
MLVTFKSGCSLRLMISGARYV